MRELAKLEPAASALLREAVDSLPLSGRAHDRVLKVSQTIADLDASHNIRLAHLAEALAYRQRAPA